MAHKIRTLCVIGGLLSMLGLAACSPSSPTSAPTPDLNPFRTEVAATVLAQVAQSLALTPSITPVPNTPIPSSTAMDLPTSTPGVTASPAASASATLSSGTPDPATENHAQWVSQTVADDTLFKPGESFPMTWRLKNTGTVAWKATYLLRYYSGETFGAAKEIAIGAEVLPGGEIEINIPMKAPANPGSYRSDWVMSTENRTNFKEPVYLKIKVAAPASPTPTTTSTPTPKP